MKIRALLIILFLTSGPLSRAETQSTDAQVALIKLVYRLSLKADQLGVADTSQPRITDTVYDPDLLKLAVHSFLIDIARRDQVGVDVRIAYVEDRWNSTQSGRSTLSRMLAVSLMDENIRDERPQLIDKYLTVFDQFLNDEKSFPESREYRTSGYITNVAGAFTRGLVDIISFSDIETLNVIEGLASQKSARLNRIVRSHSQFARYLLNESNCTDRLLGHQSLNP